MGRWASRGCVMARQRRNPSTGCSRTTPNARFARWGWSTRLAGRRAFTGARCVVAAGHVTDDGLSIQANMMEHPTVWPAMAAAYRTATGDLADHLMAALQAAEAEGGDVRGRQSAALLVVPATGPAWASRYDLRVEDHRAPLDELARLLRLARAYEAFDRSQEPALAGDLAAAAAAMDDAHELAPDDDQITLWTSLLMAGVGRLPEARRLFAEAARVEPRGAASTFGGF